MIYSRYSRGSYPCTLYVVQCNTPRTWYVGTTLRERHKRFDEHFAGVGCKWTRRHGCKRIVLHFPVSCAEASRAENDVWMHYARIYGPERVRGGGRHHRPAVRGRQHPGLDYARGVRRHPARRLGHLVLPAAAADVLPLHGTGVPQLLLQLGRLVDLRRRAAHLEHAD